MQRSSRGQAAQITAIRRTLSNTDEQRPSRSDTDGEEDSSQTASSPDTPDGTRSSSPIPLPNNVNTHRPMFARPFYLRRGFSFRESSPSRPPSSPPSARFLHFHPHPLRSHHPNTIRPGPPPPRPIPQPSQRALIFKVL